MVPSSLPTLVADSGEAWLSIRDAAAFLGVSEGALRAWADAGRVPSHRTPGGHRRFLRAELVALRDATAPAAVPSAAEDLAGRALSRVRRRMVHAQEGLLALLTEAERALLREQGRRLVDLASEFLAKPRRRGRIAQEAFEIGVAYGLCLVGHDVPLTRAMDTFVFFRNLVLGPSEPSPRSSGLSPERQRLLQALLDHVMLGIARAYEQRPPVAAGRA